VENSKSYDLLALAVPNVVFFRSKYPLACVERMLNVFGRDQGGGFDTGCQFETIINNSGLGTPVIPT
jgi:hypothetical protein